MLKNSGHNPTRYILQELAYAETMVAFINSQKLDGDVQFDKLASAHKVANVFKEIRGNTDKSITNIYLSSALVFANSKDIDGVLTYLKYISDNFFHGDNQKFSQFYFHDINEIYFSLLTAGENCITVLNKVNIFN